MKKNTYSGKFIVFEGLDGSGQSTQSNLLRKFLLEKGNNVVLTKEPTFNSQAGKKIRQILDKKEKIFPQKLQELFAEDRKEHLENIVIPALQKGEVVISDRYYFSSFAYGMSDGLDIDWLIETNNNFLLPDITFLLKVSPDVCLERIQGRGSERTLFEEKKKLEKVWNFYAGLPKRFENMFIIDGQKSIEEVFESVKKILN
ncbi:MAG: dTMP kinase [Patescibacteria group bacterium]|nr:dTMP kinase [Patescibacteria group bacterium]MBU1876879.1 dTMP kinase [Patescibacteria group bacterium]